jgi:hypothetical protein
MTPEERKRLLDQTRQVADFGHLPAGPVTAPAAAPEAAVPAGVFSAADLFALETWETRAEPVTMPNGKTVWVHPVTDDEARWLNAQAGKEARGLTITDPEEVADWAIRRARVYQVILACRVSPEWGAPRVFAPLHADAVQRNLPLPLVETIIGTSDRLGRGVSAERAAVADFFAATRTWLQTWCSGSGGGSPENWPANLAAFASCVSRVSARGYLIPADAEAVRALFPQE